ERDGRRAVDALRFGIELGLTHIDTAEIYGDGAVERLVRRAIKGQRERVHLTSKVNPVRASCSGLVRACERSLRRLGTDWLDLYLLHWQAPHPVEETVAGFELLVRAGKIRQWGVSNFDEAALAEFVDAAGPGRVCCNQVMHHLSERSIEHALVPYCREQGIAIIGYSPFAAGAFPDPATDAGRALDEVASSLKATCRQVALAFLLLKSCGFTIPKASAREHVADNAAAAALELPNEAVQLLEHAFPKGPRRAGVPLW
ncbi:MAG TPA: aldo/keto reductase, partial [Woeseiaceae bacterium]|nr:aldo/keto reductase [Woeseiaceae bacterium]